MRHIFYITLAFVLCSFSLAQAQDSSMKISSTAFAPEGSIPAEYTCDGANTSPALSWQGAPAGAKSLALIVEDPDAPRGLVTHWVVYNIPATTQGLSTALPEGISQGKNTMDKNAYSGPCPPKGKGPHRYFFRLYALDGLLNLPADADGAALKDAMKGHTLATAELMGRYEH
jgi:Raf kinase inhibitor-like YbhB/YbcL family protein